MKEYKSLLSPRGCRFRRAALGHSGRAVFNITPAFLPPWCFLRSDGGRTKTAGGNLARRGARTRVNGAGLTLPKDKIAKVYVSGDFVACGDKSQPPDDEAGLVVGQGHIGVVDGPAVLVQLRFRVGGGYLDLVLDVAGCVARGKRQKFCCDVVDLEDVVLDS